jgi:ATP-dependent Lon protease
MDEENAWFTLPDDSTDIPSSKTVSAEVLDQDKKAFDIPGDIAILPLEENVLFPELVMPWVVHGEKWVRLVNDAVLGNKMIGVISLRSKKEENGELSPADFYDIGVVGRISRLLKLPEDAVQILVYGLNKFRIIEWVRWDPYPIVKIEPIKEEDIRTDETEALSLSPQRNFYRSDEYQATFASRSFCRFQFKFRRRQQTGRAGDC